MVEHVRTHQQPYLVQAYVPLLNHHTSGVRKEFYRSKEDLDQHSADDPFPKLKKVPDGVLLGELVGELCLVIMPLFPLHQDGSSSRPRKCHQLIYTTYLHREEEF